MQQREAHAPSPSPTPPPQAEFMSQIIFCSIFAFQFLLLNFATQNHQIVLLFNIDEIFNKFNKFVLFNDFESMLLSSLNFSWKNLPLNLNHKQAAC